ncbi:MAG TPA: hypothetical protein VHR66_21025 [Gemmataceae bacterium]|nr:hypothetical protein [Gemmataceae bacterium]
MATHFGNRGVVFVAMLVLGLSGCTLYQPRPVTITVRDGDTGEPIEGAEVRTAHMVMFDFGVFLSAIGPEDGRTDPDGKLTLIIDPHKGNFHLDVTAIPYSNGDFATGRRPFADIVRGPWYAWHDEIHVDLFYGPKPIAEVTFPDDYRGPVAVRIAEQGRDRPSNGERRFQYRASTHGAVEIRERKLFESYAAYDCVEATFANGTKIPTVVPKSISNLATGDVGDDAVALRFVTPEWEQHTWFYFIGTLVEAQAFKRNVWPDGRNFNEAEFKKIVDSAK